MALLAFLGAILLVGKDWALFAGMRFTGEKK